MIAVRITAQASRDIEQAAEWYEQRREGLGLEFTDRVLEAVEAIERNAYGYAPIIRDARRAILNQFPYALWFRIDNDAVVIACLHHKRDQTLAAERVKSVIEIPKPPKPWLCLHCSLDVPKHHTAIRLSNNLHQDLMVHQRANYIVRSFANPLNPDMLPVNRHLQPILIEMRRSQVARKASLCLALAFRLREILLDDLADRLPRSRIQR